MKWFKHYTNARSGETVERLGELFGICRGYGMYFKFVEYCCYKWDGKSEPKFVFSEKKLRSLLEVSRQSLRSFSETFEQSGENYFKINEKFCEIYFPKLSEILHRDAISSGQRPARFRPAGAQEEEEKKKKNNTKKRKSPKSGYSPDPVELELVYKNFPKKLGKATGIKKITKALKSAEDFENFKKAVNNYRLEMERQGTEHKFIMMFSTFANDRWKDYVDIENRSKSDIQTQKFLKLVEEGALK